MLLGSSSVTCTSSLDPLTALARLMKKCPGCSTIWLKYRRIWRRRAWLGTMTKITSDFHFHYEESSREEEGFHYFPVHKSLVEKSLLFVVILIAGWPGCVWLASILEVWWCWWPFGRHWVPPFSSPPRLSCHALKASWPARPNRGINLLSEIIYIFQLVSSTEW